MLAAGTDFYSSPRLSPDGATPRLAEWHHPNMPWDGTELWLADVGADGGSLGEPTIAGSPRLDHASRAGRPTGILHFVAEPTGWMNLYR